MTDRDVVTRGLNERGLREGLQALNDIRITVNTLVRDAEREAAEAEIKAHAMRKLFGFVEVQITEYRAQLKTLLAQKEEPA